jgi:hypothetical protein
VASWRAWWSVSLKWDSSGAEHALEKVNRGLFPIVRCLLLTLSTWNLSKNSRKKGGCFPNITYKFFLLQEDIPLVKNIWKH